MTEVDNDLFFDAISDVALEKLGFCDKGAVNYTLYFCTALDLCPGP